MDKKLTDLPVIGELMATELGRRKLLMSAGVLGLGTFLGGLALRRALKSDLLNFKSVPASTDDEINVPEGYVAEVLISWGDPLFPDAPAFDPSGQSDVTAQLQQFGDNNDGMSLFPLDDDRAVMAVNNEYGNYGYLFAHDGRNLSADDVAKSQAAVGVSIFEIVRDGKGWKVDRAGRLNRRITANTRMQITGPAAGHPMMKTPNDKTGEWVFGTFANCANGQTPWGTYLTCEENVNHGFGSGEKLKQTQDQKRYSIKGGKSYSQWEQHDPRFDLVTNPNEAHRFGWVVEIDPKDPESVPKKRTALGRFAHENAALTLNADGHVVVYMGDDAKGEHLYRFVSKHTYKEGDDAHNRQLLEYGTLYVARFRGNASELKGVGEWVELTHGINGLTEENGFTDQGDILIFARKAATAVGATTMDRPEWVAVHPDGQTVYCTLTNNDERGYAKGQSPNAANPRVNNVYGQIIRWTPTEGDHTADTFEWDIYVLAGNPIVHRGARAGTSNVTADNIFNSPDGLGFDPAGRLWVLTDGDTSNDGEFAGMGNNQMLCGDPSTGEIRRFMTGPVGCEITGLCFSGDYQTMFVGIQHPGNGKRNRDGSFASNFPEGGQAKPRSSIVAIRRDDDGSFAD